MQLAHRARKSLHRRAIRQAWAHALCVVIKARQLSPDLPRSETGHRMHPGNAVVAWAAMSMYSVHGRIRGQAKRETRLAEPGKERQRVLVLAWRLEDKTAIVLA